MKKGLIIGSILGVSIAIIILAISLSSELKSDSIEVEDTLDKEVIAETETPEIEEKTDDVEKINLENEYSPKPREWITSGPFQIDRSKYAIGEKIFLVIGGLNGNEKGQVAFMRPLNNTHYSVYMTIPFDGMKKDLFNYYVEPAISKTKEICSIDDLIGKWAVVFRGTDYPNLYFEITDEIVPGTNIEPAC
ncbi:hypothetical protein [Nitrosarchaeum sp. AC2]|uniref:hypothetical protein n=1 Tax=Nitrosarchaeum sp. AC2 TaxID=2259673 RepID=UPI0015CEA0CF|nr:hypothetical protein [Nitrosarchaeum sp. AC2]QLH11562.1 hypothetical protein DSQ20_09035 [Nitrosarchaeum sp. AC2]